MRMPQGRADKGSQKWLQDVIRKKPKIFSKTILKQCPGLEDAKIKWLSPLKKDDYAEYRDRSFLECLGLEEHAPALRNFWPQRGPQWDGLGRTGDSSAYFLIEAKANVPELLSDCAASSPASLKKIDAGLKATREWLRADPKVDWTRGFYPYANRLAHLYFLRETVGVNAYLVNLYFVHDTTHLPTELEAWDAALLLQEKLLGIQKKNLDGLVVDIKLHTKKVKS